MLCDNVAHYEEAVHDLIEYLTRGQATNPNNPTQLLPGLIRTPTRVLTSWHNELCSGYDVTEDDIAKMLTCFDGESYDEVVLLKNVEMHSLCEHHLMPFFGVADVAYIPNGKVVGLSKLARLVEVYSRRLQMQERLTMQVTDSLMRHLQPKGVACRIRAKHLCVCARGVGKQHSEMVTSSLLGCFRSDQNSRNELMRLIGD